MYPPSPLQTPPLIIEDDASEASHKISIEREFQQIVQNSLLPENHGRQLRDASKRRRTCSFDDFQQYMMGKEASQTCLLKITIVC
jgi:hypothetical protein